MIEESPMFCEGRSKEAVEHLIDNNVFTNNPNYTWRRDGMAINSDVMVFLNKQVPVDLP